MIRSSNDDQLKKRYQKISKRRVKLAILLQYIAKENKIVMLMKKLSQGMMQYAYSISWSRKANNRIF